MAYRGQNRIPHLRPIAQHAWRSMAVLKVDSALRNSGLFGSTPVRPYVIQSILKYGSYGRSRHVPQLLNPSLEWRFRHFGTSHLNVGG
jgi:hypothetical protein